MEEIKARRLRREKRAFIKFKLKALRDGYNEYVMNQPADIFLPNTADVFFHPFVYKKLRGAESPETLVEALNMIKPKFPEIVDHCLNAIQQTLTDYIVNAYATQNHAFDPTNVKDLATTLFTCNSCGAYLTFGQAAAHRCREIRNYVFHSDKAVAAANHVINEFPWNAHKNIRFFPDQLGHIVQIFQLCGFDPVSTTVTDMNEADPIFECLACSNTHNGRATMRWLGLVSNMSCVSP